MMSAMGRSITVTGRGEASGPYDRATLRLAATARAASPADATARAAYAMSRVRTAVLASGVPESALATGAVTLSPVHDPWPTVTGYDATLALVVVSDDVDSVGSMLVSAVEAGGEASRVEGVTFEHRDRTALEKLARDRAFSAARAKAEQLAGLAGQALGEVRHVAEAGPRVDARVGLASAMKAESYDGGLPVDGGDGVVATSVTVAWALGPAL